MKKETTADEYPLSEETMQKIRQAYHSQEAFQLTDRHLRTKSKLRKLLAPLPPKEGEHLDTP